MRWREPTEDEARDLYWRAEAGASSIVRAVKKRPASSKPEDAVHSALEPMLRAAFEAGRRYGRAEREQDLDSVIRDAVENALGSIRKNVRASCPDCAGRGCAECGRTGYFDQRT